MTDTMMQWEIVTAICATTTVTGTGFAFLVKLMIRSALADFLKELNGTYRRSETCHATMVEVNHRLDRLDHLERAAGD